MAGRKPRPAPPPQAVPLDRLINKTTTRSYFGNCSDRKLRRLVEKGLLKPRAFGGVTVFVESEVLQAVEYYKNQPPGRAPWRGSSRA